MLIKRGVSKRDPTKGTRKGDPTDLMSLDYGMDSNTDSLVPKRKKKKSRVRKSTRSTPTHTRNDFLVSIFFYYRIEYLGTRVFFFVMKR